jgi:hypothetical protein
MPFDELGRYTPNHKTYDHVGNILPDVEHSEGNRPHLGDGGKVAAWLPVQLYDKHYENWVVVMPGKAVACDPDGDLMPAQYGLTSASVVYTQNDVDVGTIDIATGLPVTTAKTVVLANLDGVRDGTWTQANAGTGSVTSGFMGRFGVSFVDGTRKYPVGVAPYAYLQWAGGDGFNPTSYHKHNYNMQHRVAVLCDYVIKLPLVPAQEANEAIDKTATASALVFGSQNVYTRTNAQAEASGRYNATTGTVPVLSTYPVVALALNEQDVAKQTSRTTFVLSSTDASDDMSGVLTNERSALSAVTQAGDYWVDYAKGVIFVYSADGATLPTQISGATGTPRITYYRLGTAPGVLSKFSSVLAGGLVPGDFLKVGTESNLVKADPSSDNFADILGQVLNLEVHPKDALDRVRTAYSPAIATDASGAMANGVASSASVNAGQMDQMPGSATGGHPDLIHYAGAADTLVYINLISR